MSPRRVALSSLALVVLGCVIAAVGPAVWEDVVGITVAGIGAVGLLSAAFLAVGEAEERDRERRPHG